MIVWPSKTRKEISRKRKWFINLWHLLKIALWTMDLPSPIGPLHISNLLFKIFQQCHITILNIYLCLNYVNFLQNIGFIMYFYRNIYVILTTVALENQLEGWYCKLNEIVDRLNLSEIRIDLRHSSRNFICLQYKYQNQVNMTKG